MGAVRKFARRGCETAVLVPSALFGRRVKNRFGILMYHRVVPRIAGVAEPTYNVTPQRFRSQLAGLLARGYQPWPLRRVLGACRDGLAIPDKVFVVTFDDGYENNFSLAWPLLRELNIPATIFLATAFLDSDEPFPFDDWPAAGSRDVPAESWRPMTTWQCREMLDSGLIEFGSHTHSHENFRGRPAELGDDLRESQLVLRERFDIEQAAFAFPFGIFDAEMSAAARLAGVRCSLTTQSEMVRPTEDPFAWGRFAVNNRDSARLLAAKLDGWYSAARSAWLRLRRRQRDELGDGAALPHCASRSLSGCDQINQ